MSYAYSAIAVYMFLLQQLEDFACFPHLQCFKCFKIVCGTTRQFAILDSEHVRTLTFVLCGHLLVSTVECNAGF